MQNGGVRLVGPLWEEEGLESLQRHTTDAVIASCLRVVSLAAEGTPVDLGDLRSSYYIDVRDEIDKVVGSVGSNSEYFPFVEFGRSPGRFPPPDVILGWVRRKLTPASDAEARSIAFLVGRKIAEFGIPGVHMLQNAHEAAKPEYVAALRKAMEKWAEEAAPETTGDVAYPDVSTPLWKHQRGSR